MKGPKFLALLKTLLFLSAFSPLSINLAYGQNETDLSSLVPLENRADMKVYLHSRGRGILIPELYGHTQLRILDERSGRDIIVSWGLYDFRNPRFFLDFFKGTAEYLTAALPTRATMRYYEIDKRPVWEDELSLSLRQKQVLIDLLDENLKPQNSRYVYHIYGDNCSTRLRDLINELTHDSLRLASLGRSANTTVREIMRFHQSAIPFSGWFLDVIGSGVIDLDLSFWDKMFLPLAMRDVLLDFINPETGERIAQPTRRIIEGGEPYASVSFELSLEIILSLLLAASCWLSVYTRGELRSIVFIPAVSIRYSVAYASSLMGIVLLANEFLSGHEYLKGNWNIFVFIPADFLLVHFERYKKSFVGHSRLSRVIDIFLMARMAFPFILTGLWLSGIVNQDLSRTLLLQGFPMALWCWRILIFRRG